MVFSSVPLYLDPPNWNNQQQQQQHHHQLSHHVQLFPSAGGAGVEVQHQQQQHHQQQQQQQQHAHQQHQLPPPGTLMAPRPDSMGGGAVAVNGGGGGGGSGPTSGGTAPRPGSMTDRARMAKIPQPEPGLKCPRCESTNTKFCYFNNYSLTQPRHFCKTCRRYWTRGGALRSVPVGGGCRRNKRKSSKSSSSAASASGATTGGTSSSTSSTTTGGGNSGAAAIMPPQAGHAQAQMPFFASLHPMGSGGGDHYGTGASRLGFPGLSSLDPVDYQLGGGGAAAAALGMEQWRMPQMQQFPFFGRADGMQQQQQMAGIYPFDAAAAADGFAVTGQMLGGGGSKQVPGSSGLITQLASVKMEDNQPSNHAMASAASAREFLGLPGNLQFWGGGNNGAGGNDSEGSQNGGAIAPGGAGGGSWADLPGFNSSSSGNIM